VSTAAVKLELLEDVIKRRRVALSEIPPEDATLAAAHAYWEAKRRSGLLPARSDIDILELRPLMGVTHIVDVRDPDPKNYHVRLRGSNVPPDVERKIHNKPLHQCDSKSYGETLMEDYSTVVFTGVPSFHQVVASIDMIRHSYSRLILPLADDGRHVDTLMVCFNRRQFTDLRL
jgi:hypothetical protein